MHIYFCVMVLLLTACVGEVDEFSFDMDVGASMDAGPSAVDASMDAGPSMTDAGSPDVSAVDPDSGPALDAGALDAGSDAMTDSGASDASAGGESCPPEANLFCDNFDEGIARVWNVRVQNEGVVSEIAEGYAGSPGVHLSIGTPNGTSALLRLSDPPWSERAFWGRYQARTSRNPSNHGYLVQASGPADHGGRAQFRLDINAGRLNSRYLHPDIPAHGGLRKLGNDMPTNEWVCIEFYYDTAGNEMRYFFNGVENEEMRVDGTEDPPWNGPNADRFEVGLHHYQMDMEGTEMTIDSVAIGTERIGCD